MQNRIVPATLLALAAILCMQTQSRAALLYDGTLGTDPTTQGLAYGAFPSATYYTVGTSSLTLSTVAANVIYAGFTNSAPLVLDRTAGFTVSTDLRILTNSQTNPDRAGFSIIALGSDHLGVEIGVHGDEIFSQQYIATNSTIVRAESIGFDSTASLKRFALNIVGSTYTLSVDGSPRLTGPVRDYSAYPGLNPYGANNFLFFGDDSTSASGTTEFSRIEVLTPEPMAIGAITLALPILRRKR